MAPYGKHVRLVFLVFFTKVFYFLAAALSSPPERTFYINKIIIILLFWTNSLIMISDSEVFDCLRRGTTGLGEYKPVMPDRNPALQRSGYTGSALSLSHGQAARMSFRLNKRESSPESC